MIKEKLSHKEHNQALRTSACSGPGSFLAQYPGSWAHPMDQSCKGQKFGLLLPESGDDAAIKHHYCPHESSLGSLAAQD